MIWELATKVHRDVWLDRATVIGWPLDLISSDLFVEETQMTDVGLNQVESIWIPVIRSDFEGPRVITNLI